MKRPRIPSIIRCIPARIGQTLLLFALFVNGCAHVPSRETAQYADAFVDVAAITEDLLSDYSAAIDSSAARNDAVDAQSVPYPIRFDPGAALAEDQPVPAVVRYQNALHAITAYNALLRDIAQGSGGKPMRMQATAAAALMQILTHGTQAEAAPLANIAQQLMSLIANARSDKQFRDAIARGYPLVEQLLHGFVRATPDFYQVRAGIVGAAITEIEFKEETVLGEIDRIARDYAPPTPGSGLALQRAQVETDVAALRRQIAPDGTPRALPTGAQTYDAAAQDRLEEQVRVLRGLCAQRLVLAAGLTEYHGHLTEYVRLLDDTKRYLDVLVRAAGGARNLDAAVRAHDVALKAGKLRTEFRDTRSAAALLPNTSSKH